MRLPAPSWIYDDEMHRSWPWDEIKLVKLQWHSLSCVCKRCLYTDQRASHIQGPILYVDVIIGYA